MSKVEERRWTWAFEQPPERVWAALADTARFNEAAGLPKHRIEETPQPDGSVIFTGHARMGPFQLSWRDLPVEWIRGRSFCHARRFHSGPFETLTATLTLTPDGAGTRADYDLAVAPRNLLGRLLLAGGFFNSTAKTFARLANEARLFLAGQRDQPFVFKPAALTTDGKRRLDAAVQRLEAEGADKVLVQRLVDLVLNGPEVELAHLRPLALAHRWLMPERPVIELCLAAVRAGLFEMRWDLLCPMCRGAKSAAVSLDGLPRGTHCNTCNIDYDRDFDRNVELTFRPAAGIRALGEGEFCLFGPMTTPHVAIQQTLAAGETREIAAELPFGSYRLRGLSPIGQASLDWNEGGFPEFLVDAEGVRAGMPAPPGRVRLVNRLDREVTLVVESRAWIAEALTAHRATTLQVYRDLFSADVLRPGDEVAIGFVTLMFTDIGGSTALYSKVGDATAFRLVRDHFAFLTETVRQHNGAIVKTIGDAIMGAFRDPEEGVAAALAVQRNVAHFNRDHAAAIGAPGIIIKVGLHAGPCIAVTLNDRLDYFGTTVNLAARLQDQSYGGDIVLSEALVGEPAVANVLAGLKLQRESAAMKGFSQPIHYWRLTPEALMAEPMPA